MAGPCTVDASVFLNAFNPAEPGHSVSNRLLSRMQSLATPMIVPTLVLPEIAATIRRVQGNIRLAYAFATKLENLSHLTLISLDLAVARQAAKMASQHRLCGSDAVYAAVALRYGATLITLDREQHDRLAPVVSSRYPAEMMEELQEG
ncbi:MAG TPA: type II toxin-antitoxin system VapC family toxin [Acidobacteriota bacterium]|jgi:predicted nucleic acid-binding protein